MFKGLAATLGLWVVGAVLLRTIMVPAQVCPAIDADEATLGAQRAADWIARVQAPAGTYLYEYDIEANREVPGYNVVRHAGVTMSLYQLAAEGYGAETLDAADRGLAYMTANLVEYEGWRAFIDPSDGGIEVGASALMLAGLAQRRIATNDGQHDGLMRDLARYLVAMQQADGSFLLRWLPETGEPDPTQRSRYATGEAFWSLTLMHRFFPAEGWDRPARAVADYLSLYRDEVEGLRFPPWADQWAAFGLSEMASWPLNEDNVRYARRLSERFGFLIRTEAQRRDSRFSDLIHGRRARAAGMGTWVEALDSLWRLASVDPRLSDLVPKLAERAICGAGMLRDRQVSPGEASNYTNPGVAEGAWFTEGKTRMDDQQHALSGLIRARPILAEAGK